VTSSHPDRRTFLAASSSAGLFAVSPRWLHAAGSPASMQVFVTGDSKRHEAQPAVAFGTSATASADIITVDANTRFQPILGFGSALTDASCWLLNQMQPQARQQFLADTYSPGAMNLNMGRVAIGSSDYSRNVFNYDDVAGDITMQHFNIEHDRAYILPMLREIRSLNPSLFVLASPWSPPGWMKTYGSMLGGWMSAPFLAPYALYFVKFLEAYRQAGVKVDAVTSQNELETDQGGSMPATYWTPDMESDFVRDHLGPALRDNRLETQIWLLDHNYDLWKRVRWQLRDAELRKFVAGVAWHGYVGTPDMMSRLHEVDPDVPFYWTEGGPDYTNPKYETEWARWGIIFIEAMRNWCRGIITWNLMLDPQGKPNIGPFECGGLVTVKPDSKLVYSGQYWALRHLSQHVRRGAVRTASHSDATELQHIAFQNPDGSRVLFVTNAGAARTLAVAASQGTASVDIPGDSVVTLLWT
jgi:glucosylceramidase